VLLSWGRWCNRAAFVGGRRTGLPSTGSSARRWLCSSWNGAGPQARLASACASACLQLDGCWQEMGSSLRTAQAVESCAVSACARGGVGGARGNKGGKGRELSRNTVGVKLVCAGALQCRAKRTVTRDAASSGPGTAKRLSWGFSAFAPQSAGMTEVGLPCMLLGRRTPDLPAEMRAGGGGGGRPRDASARIRRPWRRPPTSDSPASARRHCARPGRPCRRPPRARDGRRRAARQGGGGGRPGGLDARAGGAGGGARGSAPARRAHRGRRRAAARRAAGRAAGGAAGAHLPAGRARAPARPPQPPHPKPSPGTPAAERAARLCATGRRRARPEAAFPRK